MSEFCIGNTNPSNLRSETENVELFEPFVFRWKQILLPQIKPKILPIMLEIR